MKFFRRKELTPSDRLSIAVTAFMQRGVWGSITNLARQYSVSRQSVYLMLWTLLMLFEPEGTPSHEGQAQQVELSWDKLVLAFRLHGRCSVGGLSAALKSLGVPNCSVGKISEYLNDIAASIPQERPKGRDLLVVLADEIFMASKPILILTDAKSHYILKGIVAEDRDGQTWASLYDSLKSDGYNPIFAVGDCGVGLRRGCQLAGLVHHPDLMHLVRPLGPFLFRLERKAYQAIDLEYERRRVLDSARSEKILRERQDRYQQARNESDQAIRRYDDYAYLHSCLTKAFDLFNTDGSLRTRKTVESEVLTILDLMETEWADPSLIDVIRKLKKILPDYWPYFDRAHRIHVELRLILPPDVLREICLGWQTRRKARACKDYRRKKSLEHIAKQHFFLARCSDVPQHRIASSLDRLDDNVRSSSPLEAINSQIRDFINTARGQISQKMLDLIVNFLNHKIASRGPYKGTSPYQRFSGNKETLSCPDIFLSLANHAA